MKLQKTTIAAVMILTGGLLLSQDRFDMQVRNYFFAGLAGDGVSLQKGMKICEAILASDPKQPEALRSVPKGRPAKWRGNVAARSGRDGPSGGHGA